DRGCLSLRCVRELACVLGLLRLDLIARAAHRPRPRRRGCRERCSEVVVRRPDARENDSKARKEHGELFDLACKFDLRTDETEDELVQLRGLRWSVELAKPAVERSQRSQCLLEAR